MTWDEAKAVAVNGTKIRVADSDIWFWRTALGAWMMQEPGEEPQFVQATHFGAPEFFDRTWTTQPIADEDVCSRPGAARPQFDSPIVHVRASYSAGVVTVTGVVTAGTFGKYRLIYFINGEALAFDTASAEGEFTKSFSTGWLPEIRVTFRVESALPLAPWNRQAVQTLRPSPPVCLTMPTGDVVIEITGARFAQYVAGGTWHWEADFVDFESYTGGGSSGTGSGAGDVVSTGCSVTVPTPYSGEIDYTPSPLDFPFTNYASVSLAYGYSGGKYWLAVSMTDPDYATTSAGVASPYGTAELTVDGHSIPVRSIWGPGYAGMPGYTTTTHSNIVLSFSP